MYGQNEGELWPADTIEEKQIREVYSRYGLAMYQVQVLEHGVVNAIIAYTLIKNRDFYATKEEWWDAVDNRFSRELGQTFGNLIKEIEKIGFLPKDFVDRLRASKEPRDILAHRFFRLHVEDFLHAKGRRDMIVWCEQQIEAFLALDQELETYYGTVLETAGITREWLATRVDEELERFGFERDIEPIPF